MGREEWGRLNKSWVYLEKRDVKGLHMMLVFYESIICVNSFFQCRGKYCDECKEESRAAT